MTGRHLAWLQAMGLKPDTLGMFTIPNAIFTPEAEQMLDEICASGEFDYRLASDMEDDE